MFVSLLERSVLEVVRGDIKRYHPTRENKNYIGERRKERRERREERLPEHWPDDVIRLIDERVRV